MPTPPIARRIAATLILVIGIGFAVACSAIGAHDKMWIPNEKYDRAKLIYDKTNSIALTRERLEADPTWQRGEINEAVYRLRKFYRLEEEKKQP